MFVKLIMSIYSSVLKQFQEKFGHTEFLKFNRQQLSKNLDILAQMNHTTDQFDPNIKEEIFAIVNITYDKKIILKDFATTIQKIFDIICKYIAETQKNIESQTVEQDLAVYKQNIRQFTANKEYLCSIFRLPIRSQSKILIKINNQQQSQFQQSQTLKTPLVLLVVSIILQAVLSLSRSGFMNSLVYALALGAFILNFFDRPYIRVCILAFLISLLFDLLRFFKTSNLHVNSSVSDIGFKYGSLTEIKIILLRFSYTTSIILMASKLMLVIIFMRFRNNSIYKKMIVRVLDTKFYLQGRPFVSPISKLIIKDHAQQELYCL